MVRSHRDRRRPLKAPNAISGRPVTESRANGNRRRANSGIARCSTDETVELKRCCARFARARMTCDENLRAGRVLMGFKPLAHNGTILPDRTAARKFGDAEAALKPEGE